VTAILFPNAAPIWHVVNNHLPEVSLQLPDFAIRPLGFLRTLRIWKPNVEHKEEEWVEWKNSK